MITTPPNEIEAGLEMSLRFLEPLRARVAELELQIKAVGWFFTTLNKANEAGEPRGLEIGGEVWIVRPNDSALEQWELWRKGENNEGMAMR